MIQRNPYNVRVFLTYRTVLHLNCIGHDSQRQSFFWAGRACVRRDDAVCARGEPCSVKELSPHRGPLLWRLPRACADAHRVVVFYRLRSDHRLRDPGRHRYVSSGAGCELLPHLYPPAGQVFDTGECEHVMQPAPLRGVRSGGHFPCKKALSRGESERRSVQYGPCVRCRNHQPFPPGVSLDANLFDQGRDTTVHVARAEGRCPAHHPCHRWQAVRGQYPRSSCLIDPGFLCYGAILNAFRSYPCISPKGGGRHHPPKTDSRRRVALHGAVRPRKRHVSMYSESKSRGAVA